MFKFILDCYFISLFMYENSKYLKYKKLNIEQYVYQIALQKTTVLYKQVQQIQSDSLYLIFTNSYIKPEIMSQHLPQKDEDYKSDFDDDKNLPLSVDVQLQTTPIQLPPQFTQPQQRYEQDFVQPSIDANKNSSALPKKYYDNNPNRDKMIQQNIKLKTQIYQLAKQMDEIAQRQKKGKKYGLHSEQQDDESIKSKKTQLKKQLIEITSLKNKILQTKKQLQQVYDSRGVQGKEDQLKNLQKELKVLLDEKESLQRVKRQQTKALKLIRNDHEYEDKVKHLKQQISELKQQCKHLSDKLVQNQRVLRKNHQVLITKQARIKEMETKIKEKGKKGVNLSNSPVTTEMIRQLQQQLSSLETMKKESERTWHDKIQAIQSELSSKRLQEQKKELLIRQKQKELKLNEIRIKQLKKLIQHHSNEPVSKKQQQPNMKEYRHQRNIKHLDK